MVRLLAKDKDLQNLNQAFLCIDSDNNGIISEDEINEFVSKL